jgi:hypothetical protein
MISILLLFIWEWRGWAFKGVKETLRIGLEYYVYSTL